MCTWSGTPDSNRLHPPIGRDAAYAPLFLHLDCSIKCRGDYLERQSRIELEFLGCYQPAAYTPPGNEVNPGGIF